MKFVLAEKPSVAQSLAKVLGANKPAMVIWKGPAGLVDLRPGPTEVERRSAISSASVSVI